ncbi:hypothetical protein [Marinobacterium jannaschii]|uniref:hypothetical protein n=1 Tax=Marinobacterium jannaschii TaxID=64970 RepID=UPI0004821232|nr:hypothetical protein [Marinobacterium jannaschii]
METIEQYLDRTESASHKLFEGIDSYSDVLREAKPLTFITSTLDRELMEQEYLAWRDENQEALEARREAERAFVAESFALANLCGAVLQTASMAISKFSTEQPIPPVFRGLIQKGQRVTKYCVGREVRGVPIGLIIYAGRNQYNHFDERPKLKNPAKTVFAMLANMGISENNQPLIDPAFNLTNDHIVCFANNITTLLGWCSYQDYRDEMLAMLGEKLR